MTVNNFIPDVWSARLLVNLNKALVYGQPGVINSDYEGEIRQMGDSVRINAIGPITLLSYTKNSDLTDPETLTDASTVLLINQGDAFNFQIDDVDRAQSNIDFMDDAMREAGYTLANAADQYIAALHSGVDTVNKVGLGGTLSSTTPETFAASTDAYDRLVDLSVVLDTANVPAAGRWVIIPPWYHGLLRKDSRFVGSGAAAADARLQNGIIGEVSGMTVIKSNNVPNTGGTLYKIMAGYPGAITYASQISKIEAFRPEKRFADAMKGLHVYGAKLVRSSGIAVLTANPKS